ncbi:hypothetical protein AB0N14_17930 [Streptomyces sp. NPDC051104]|uniref:hypothetical protein n=1 Tax=Streptomyces sp. NPDC051104 TaxID=3155044 RepID=UPI0034123268
MQKLGPFKGRITGSQSPDGLRGWRIDFDPANPDKGFHVNWWVKNGPKRSDGWSYGVNVIDGGSYDQYLEILSHFPHQ